MEYESTLGYGGRYIGGAMAVISLASQIKINDATLLDFIPIFSGTVTPEEALSAAASAATLYFIGDRIHARELREKEVSALEKLAKK